MNSRRWIAAAALVVFAACGDEINGPKTIDEQTDITVVLDWELAREPWILWSGWDLQVRDSDDGPSCPGGFDDPCWSSNTSNLTTIDEGLFEPDGSARIRFSALCAPGQPLDGHVIRPWALKSSRHRDGDRIWAYCRPGWVTLTCSDGVQHIPVTDRPDDSRCTVSDWVETEIHLQLDWALSREPGFEDATWALIRQQPSTSQATIEWVTVDEGSLLADGTAEVRFTTFCEPGEVRRLNERIELRGRFGVYKETLVDPECRVQEDLRCTSETQRLASAHSYRTRQCTTPAEEP